MAHHGELETLRRGRRLLSGAVSLAAIALVMAAVHETERGAANPIASIASVAFVVSLVLLVLVWRREHAANEAAFAARAEQRLALMKLQIELAKKKERPEPADHTRAPDVTGTRD